MLVHSLLVFFPNDCCTVFQRQRLQYHSTSTDYACSRETSRLGSMPKFGSGPHTSKTGIFWVKHQIWFTTQLWACESQWCLYLYMVVWLGTHIRPFMSSYGSQSLKHILNKKSGRTLPWRKTTIIYPPEYHNSEFRCSFTLVYAW